MQLPDPPARPLQDPPFRADRPSREEVIVTEALRRRALAIARRRLPAIIREARYEELRRADRHILLVWQPGSHAARGPRGLYGDAGADAGRVRMPWFVFASSGARLRAARARRDGNPRRPHRRRARNAPGRTGPRPRPRRGRPRGFIAFSRTAECGSSTRRPQNCLRGPALRRLSVQD